MVKKKQKKDELSEDQIIDLIADFYQDPDFEELQRLYLTKSFPEILAVDRREEIHSAFLAWLLDMNESHGLGDFPIKQFLKILVRRDRQQGLSRHDNNNANNNAGITSTKNIYVEILNEDFTITEMYVTREKPTQTEDRKGRMDILINMKAIFSKKHNKNIHIVIENKVYSKENNDQTKKYYDNIIKEFSKDICLFVYLTPLPKSDLDDLIKPECSCQEYIQTNYQDLLDYILEPAVKKDISMRNRFVIEEYINCLSLPAINIDNDEYNINLNTILAMADKTKNLLKSFWEKNEPLLMAALSSLVETTDDVDIKEELNDALNALKQRKDNTHYEFDKTGPEIDNKVRIVTKGKADLVTTVVQEFLENGFALSAICKSYEKVLEPLKGLDKISAFKKINEVLGDDNMTCRQYNSKFKTSNINKLVLDETGHEEWKKVMNEKKEKRSEGKSESREDKSESERERK